MGLFYDVVGKFLSKDAKDKYLVHHKYENEKFYKPDDVHKKDAVWGRKNINDMMVAMCNRLTKKSHYGENMDVLTEEEKIFYIATEVECEVNVGGFERFFYESSGKFANDSVHAMEMIGATNMAFICKEALDSVGGSLPEDMQERHQQLKEVTTDEVRVILEKCDKAFEEDPDDFNGLVFNYMSQNSDKFEETYVK